MKKLLAFVICLCGMIIVVAEEAETPAAEPTIEEVAVAEQDNSPVDALKAKKPAQEETSPCASCYK